MVRNDWLNISQKEKAKLEDEYRREKEDLALDIDNSDRINDYKERLERYKDLIREDKEKIMKKYGISKESQAKLKRIERQQERMKKYSQRRL